MIVSSLYFKSNRYKNFHEDVVFDDNKSKLNYSQNSYKSTTFSVHIQLKSSFLIKRTINISKPEIGQVANKPLLMTSSHIYQKLIQTKNIKLMNSQCTQPACVYNCCNQYGQCPTSIRECVTKRNFDPLTVQIAVCVIVTLIIIATVVVLKCKWRKKQKQLTSKESFITEETVKNEDQKVIQIQMGLKSYINHQREQVLPMEEPIIKITTYRKTNQMNPVADKRISDIFSTSRQSRISEQVEIFFSRRFSRILDDNQQ